MLVKVTITCHLTINKTHKWRINIDHPEDEGMTMRFDGNIKLEFHGAKVTSDGGLLAYRDLDDVLGLFDSVSTLFNDLRTVRDIQHDMPTLMRQSVYSRLAGYEDVDGMWVQKAMSRLGSGYLFWPIILETF